MSRAVIIGSGPNGLTAGALLARAGWQVEVYEGQHTPGGAAASAALLGEGTISDLGAAGHPFGIASPAFRSLDLESHGLTWAHSRYPMAHPIEAGRAAFLHRSVSATAAGLGVDGKNWRRLHAGVTEHIDAHLANLLGPLTRIPPHPMKLLKFGPAALLPAQLLARAAFRTEESKVLFTGSAVHAIAAPSQPLTAGFGLLFGALGMSRGWPVALGGSQAIIDALVKVLKDHGGVIHTGHQVTDLREFATADAVVLNLAPGQVLQLAGNELGAVLKHRMRSWRYGTASHKLDILLDGPIPWENPEVGEAATVHVCGSSAEIQRAEAEAAAGQLPERPFVLVCQQQVADPSRAGPGQTVVWAYAHVPQGVVDKRVRERILGQIERFAPGFRGRIRRIVEHTPRDLESWNPNLVGGDVAGGATTGLQGVLRLPHRLGPKLYLASASTSPGGGVHGMPGWWAAQAVLRS